MKLFNKNNVLSIFILVLFSSFENFSFNIYLTGRLKNKTGSSKEEVGDLTVFVKGKNQILATAKSNSKGVFHLTWTDNNAKYFYIYCILDKDSVLIGKIGKLKSEEPDLTFYLPDM